MKKPIIIIGVGEMGAVFARGFLRIGHPVYPVTRGMDMTEVATDVTAPEAVLVAVSEADLQTTLEQLPSSWTDRLILLQNELLPKDFAHLTEPTIISVWFEKKKGQDSKVIIPSPAYGPKAALLQDALGSLDIPVTILDTADDLLFELVLKNVYILTTNIAGLRAGGNVGELWKNRKHLAQEVANEIIEIQQALTGQALDSWSLIDAMLVAFEGDPEHQCMGRSAPARLKRALAHAAELGIEVPTLQDVADKSLDS